jgi:hypothetical protein
MADLPEVIMPVVPQVLAVAEAETVVVVAEAVLLSSIMAMSVPEVETVDKTLEVVQLLVVQVVETMEAEALTVLS